VNWQASYRFAARRSTQAVMAAMALFGFYAALHWPPAVDLRADAA